MDAGSVGQRNCREKTDPRALTCRTYFIVVQMLQVVNINPEANSALHTLGDRMMFLKCATHVIVVVVASRRAVP